MLAPCNLLVPVLHQSFSLFCNSLFFTSMVQRSAIPEGGKVIQSGKKCLGIYELDTWRHKKIIKRLNPKKWCNNYNSGTA